MNPYRAIVYSINYLADVGIKTANYMNRTVSSLVKDLYAGDIAEADFIDSMSSLIEAQFKRAINEALRENGVKWGDVAEAEYQRLVTDQYEYIEKFAKDILNGVDNGSSIDQFKARAELWANQYESVKNEALLKTGPQDARYVWRLGATEEHCTTCYSLDGVVATAEQWDASGFHPQQPPNDGLDCGGWRCDCSLEVTDEPLTEDFFKAIKGLEHVH